MELGSQWEDEDAFSDFIVTKEGEKALPGQLVQSCQAFKSVIVTVCMFETT